MPTTPGAGPVTGQVAQTINTGPPVPTQTISFLNNPFTTPNVANLTGNTGSISMPGVLSWFAAWLIVLGVLWAISRTTWGRPITYYSLWLMVVLTVVTHYQPIVTILNQGNITQGQLQQ